MKHVRWMAALVAVTLFLAACGSMQDAETFDPMAEITVAVAPDTQIDQTNPDFDAMATVDHWLAELGDGAICWAIATESSETDYLITFTPAGYTWRLAVVTKFETVEGAGDGMHYLFEDPMELQILETGGYDQVIVCKTPDEPKEEEGEWCSPGYWRQPHHLDSWEPTGLMPGDSFFDQFGFDPSVSRLGVRQGAPTSPTLLEVLQKPQWYGGDAFNLVGDLLSEAHPDVSFGGERVEDSCPLN